MTRIGVCVWISFPEEESSLLAIQLYSKILHFIPILIFGLK
jgi:hypothetical protein